MACPENSDKTVNEATDIEHNLTKKLHFAFSKTCEKFISHVKFSQMKRIFRMIYRENPESLKNIHDQLCSQMQKSIMDDLNELCKEHCMDLQLDSLEVLKKHQKPSQHSWRPSGDPKEDLRDHIYPIKLEYKEDLQAVLTKLQIANEELINEVSVNHAEILHLKKCNDDLYGAFNDITSSFTGNNLKRLEENLYSKLEQA